MASTTKVAFCMILVGSSIVGAYWAGRSVDHGSTQSPVPDITTALEQLEQRVTHRMDELERRTLEAMPQDHRAKGVSAKDSTPSRTPEAESSKSYDDTNLVPKLDDGPAPEQIATFDASQKALDKAIAQKSWSEQDRQDLRGSLVKMTDDQRVAVMDRLILAINQGRVQSTAVPPF